MTEKILQSKYIKMGIVMSILAAITYPLFFYLDPGIKIEMLIILLFSISIGLSSIGIYHFLSLHKKRPCLELGLRLTVLAALIFALSGTVKLALETPLEGILVQGDQSFIYGLNDRIVIGLSFLWKILFGLGVLFLAVPALNHPKTGKIIAVFGILLGLILLVINFWAFPHTPMQADLIGLGPFVPIWHLLIAIIMALSGRWVNEKLTD